MNLLFLCSRNRLRSPTAERVFADRAETDSAGPAPDADLRLSGDQVQWADLIVVMEKSHRAKLKRAFPRQLAGKLQVTASAPTDDASILIDDLTVTEDAWVETIPAGTAPQPAVTDTVVRSQSGRILQNTLTDGADTEQWTYGFDAAGRLTDAALFDESSTTVARHSPAV